MGDCVEVVFVYVCVDFWDGSVEFFLGFVVD